MSGGYTAGRCGTYAGWNVHQRNHEMACGPCLAARNEYTRVWRLRTGRVKSIRVRPSPALLQLLGGAPQPPGGTP